MVVARLNTAKNRMKDKVPGMNSEPEQPEFITILLRYMHERGIESPNDLWRRLKGRGKRGNSPSRSAVQNYFRPDKNTGEWQAPGRWFVRACMELLELDHKKCCELCKAYFYSYE